MRSASASHQTHLNPLESAVDEVPVKNVLVGLGRHPVVVHQVDQIRQLPVNVPDLYIIPEVGMFVRRDFLPSD